MPALNSTHDPALKSWVPSANLPDSDFPIQNLPFGVFRRAGSREDFRGGVAIGDQILDLGAMHALGLLSGKPSAALAGCARTHLNDFMAMGQHSWSALRQALSECLREGSASARALATLLTPQAQAEYTVPANIRNFTDFYASVYHAASVGRMFRPDNPLLPNYKWVPIAYHGRASSIRVSGQEFSRPIGQTLPGNAQTPLVGPSRRLDYELELGVYIGVGNELGSAIPIDRAEEHVFGLCLLNDWSARDLQAWEYQPLGPFLAKNFATTISPWIVTLEALAPFRAPWTRLPTDPAPLPYLEGRDLRDHGAINIQLEVLLDTARMRAEQRPPQRLSQSNFRDCYWSVSQMVAHHTINGCNLEVGDLLGTGTQSGPSAAEAGSLLELSAGGKQKLTLSSGESRGFLEDGDRLLIRAHCEQPGRRRIGFGEVNGTVLPARC
jgi:fumarylacetoacetase